MIGKINSLSKLLIIFVFVFVSGCNDSGKPKKTIAPEPEKISKKISIPVKPDLENPDKKAVTGESSKELPLVEAENKKTTDSEPQTASLGKDSDSSLEKKNGNDKDFKKSSAKDQPKEEQSEKTSKFIKNLLGQNEKEKKESIDLFMLYNPEGRINPFSPLVKESVSAKVNEADKKDKKAQRPKTPLEKFDLSQLKLVAIMSAPDGDIAVLEESSGKGYLVEKGTYVGLNSGQIITIESDRIIIKETIEDISGRSVEKESVLQIQKPVGE